jgi:integrase
MRPGRSCLPELRSPAAETTYAIAAFRILLLTGCRLSEIQTLEWRHVDLLEKELRLPDSKTGAKTVHLGNAAVTLLEAIPRVKDNPYVIVGKKENTHLTDLQHPWRRIREAAGLGDVRIHDLRHTFASGGLLVGEGLAMIGKLLGHTQVQTTARYAHLAADPVKQAATKISDRLALALLGALDKPSAGKAKQSGTSINNEADETAAA